MNITAQYIPRTKCLDLKYDQEAKDVFTSAAKLVYRFCGEADCFSDDDEGLKLFADTMRGMAVLARMGPGKIPVTYIRASDLRLALKAASLTGLYLCDRGQSFSPLENAIYLLASATPMPLPRLPLPPPAEVFDKSSTSATVWKSYETVRGWCHGGRPQVFLTEIYSLWNAMQKIAHPSDDLQRFIHCLDQATESFRFTMGCLAQAELKKGAQP